MQIAKSLYDSLQIAKSLYDSIVTHANYKQVCKNAQGGFHMRVYDAATRETDRIPINGITKALMARFAPKFSYIARKTQAIGVPKMYKYRQIKNNVIANVKKSQRALRLDAAEEGIRVHEQLALYAYCFITAPYELILPQFEQALATRNQVCYSATTRAIAAFNTLKDGQIRWIPIIGDLPVCDVTAVLSHNKHAWATGADLVVYDVLMQKIIIVEVKTTNGSFAEGRHAMQAPFQDWRDSQLNIARLQLAITIELFIRTYGSLLSATMQVAGLILHVPANNNSPAVPYEMGTEEIRAIVVRLQSADWF